MTFRFPTNLYNCIVVDGIITVSLKVELTNQNNNNQNSNSDNQNSNSDNQNSDSNILSCLSFYQDYINDDVIVEPEKYLDEFMYRGKKVYNGISPHNLHKVYTNHCRKLNKMPLRQKGFSNGIKKYIERGKTTKKGDSFRFYLL